ncbi:hypothetical protein FCV43_12215 [Vibrio genomosp. F6]|uniref:hypothetical protein n=1 Tax=Vibrio genomosp. F6 TaxID=723172 RepID=UPI0010BDC450|nr:hypothetical protein [Vibrio genomosp. F6]TKF21159.1 hypothetical protein FCV43_12215 [Vibrio genomosp. F6]
MADFCIQVKNNKVKTDRIVDGNLEVIRFSGEVWISDNDYWDKFKTKVEYCENEKLAFVLMSDIDSFEIDSSISISDVFTNSERSIKWIIDSYNCAHLHITLYPDVFDAINIGSGKGSKEDAISTEMEFHATQVEQRANPDNNSLQNHYRKVTRGFSRGTHSE